MRPWASRAQDAHRPLDRDPDGLRGVRVRCELRTLLGVPIRDRVPYRGVPLPAVRGASARMNQISSFHTGVIAAVVPVLSRALDTALMLFTVAAQRP